MVHKLLVPDNRNVTLNLKLPASYVGEEVEVVAFIKKGNKQKMEMAALLSPALPGKALSNKAFNDWISKAEQMPSIPLSDAKKKWAKQRKELLQLIK